MTWLEKKKKNKRVSEQSREESYSKKGGNLMLEC